MTSTTHMTTVTTKRTTIATTRVAARPSLPKSRWRRFNNRDSERLEQLEFEADIIARQIEDTKHSIKFYSDLIEDAEKVGANSE